MNDETLKLRIASLHNGNKAAFEESYQELKTPVYTIIFRILYDRALSEDVMQEVFLRLFRSPPDSRINNPRAFIFRIARNLAIDSKRKPAQAALSDETESTGRSVEDAVILRLGVEKAMEALPIDDREIVTLHINAGLKFREIAKILDIPLGTALWKYQKAIRRLCIELSGGV